MNHCHHIAAYYVARGRYVPGGYDAAAACFEYYARACGL